MNDSDAKILAEARALAAKWREAVERERVATVRAFNAKIWDGNTEHVREVKAARAEAASLAAKVCRGLLGEE